MKMSTLFKISSLGLNVSLALVVLMDRDSVSICHRLISVTVGWGTGRFCNRMFSGTWLTWNSQRTASYCIASQSEVWGCPLRHCPGPRVIDVNTVVGAVDIIGDRHALSISP